MEKTIEIKDLEDNLVTIPVEKIQFFWQKRTEVYPIVTQIVYNTDEPLVFEGGSPAGEIPWIQGRVVSGRAVVDTGLAAYDVLRIFRSEYSKKIIVTHRSHDWLDNRVLCPYPSELFDSLKKQFELYWSDAFLQEFQHRYGTVR
jgi:hypothetical protein